MPHRTKGRGRFTTRPGRGRPLFVLGWRQWQGLLRAGPGRIRKRPDRELEPLRHRCVRRRRSRLAPPAIEQRIRRRHARALARASRGDLDQGRERGDRVPPRQRTNLRRLLRPPAGIAALPLVEWPAPPLRRCFGRVHPLGIRRARPPEEACRAAHRIASRRRLLSPSPSVTAALCHPRARFSCGARSAASAPSRPARSWMNCQATRPDRAPRVTDHSTASACSASLPIGRRRCAA